MRELFAPARENDPEPPLPPQFVEDVVTAGRRSVRRRRTAAAALVVLAVLFAVAVTPALHGPRVAPAAPAPGPAVLPDRFAPFSLLTRPVGAHPAGPAIMIYRYGNGELVNQWQSVAVGADGASYRRVAADERGDGARGWLLSPDGATVVSTALGHRVSAITLVDLVTGVEREVALPAPTGVVPLAFSADGRQLAYATVDGRLDPIISDTVQDEAGRTGVLAVLDLATGASTRFPTVSPVLAAAFGPDGRLAVQTGPATVRVGPPGGPATATVTLPDDHRLVDGVAWSPDGRLLAVAGATSTFIGGSTYEVRPHVAFVDATGAAGPVPAPVEAGQLLGWRGPDRILAYTTTTPPGEISEIPLGGGAPTVLARFPGGAGCEYRSQPCLVADVRFAAGRLDDLVVRPAADPDRGPWPAWFVLVLAGGAGGVLLIGAALVSAVRRRPT